MDKKDFFFTLSDRCTKKIVHLQVFFYLKN
jgi:hypothetical protein